MIDHGAENWNMGLIGACHGGHIDICNWMIKLGANHWDCGLHFACLNKMKMVKFMIEKGATDWDGGLSYVTSGQYGGDMCFYQNTKIRNTKLFFKQKSKIFLSKILLD